MTRFRERHDAVGATAILTDPDGNGHHVAMVRVDAGLDAWSAALAADRAGMWPYRVEGWVGTCDAVDALPSLLDRRARRCDAVVTDVGRRWL
uniref:maltotransferase domain-containing protein n=1 Tax=Paractinoplanes polyasparticus TaxID=2856853 RepID=UPI001C85AFB9|nr:maltotransferase domain-containing protein [Actinoplanes polyasparticus]